MLDLAIKVILQDFAEQVVKDVQVGIRTKRVTKYGAMNASGQAADSVKYRLTETGFEIFVNGKAAAYIDTLESGRKPGKQPPRAELKSWVMRRGIPEKWHVSVDTATFLIARKIGRDGTTVFQQGGKTGIITDSINPQRLAELREKLVPALIADITAELKTNIGI
jgi:hypothetical protein